MGGSHVLVAQGMTSKLARFGLGFAAALATGATTATATATATAAPDVSRGTVGARSTGMQASCAPGSGLMRLSFLPPTCTCTGCDCGWRVSVCSWRSTRAAQDHLCAGWPRVREGHAGVMGQGCAVHGICSVREGHAYRTPQQQFFLLVCMVQTRPKVHLFQHHQSQWLCALSRPDDRVCRIIMRLRKAMRPRADLHVLA